MQTMLSDFAAPVSNGKYCLKPVTAEDSPNDHSSVLPSIFTAVGAFRIGMLLLPCPVFVWEFAIVTPSSRNIQANVHLLMS
jgi:hypothetical protein